MSIFVCIGTHQSARITNSMVSNQHEYPGTDVRQFEAQREAKKIQCLEKQAKYFGLVLMRPDDMSNNPLKQRAAQNEL